MLDKTMEIDYESLTWDDVHLSEWALDLLNESAGVFKHLVD